MKDISDPTYVAELVEFAESMLNELNGIGWQLHDLENEVLHALEVQRRRVANIAKNLADLLDASVPAVLRFEEVDR